ncbi:MAG: 50S ribosomal protein L6 [Patescibacteria group bacterium]|nr:50S ribosomal protein L6 [Patescibacteria group bacterium]
MSRIGKKIIEIPQGVEVKIEDDFLVVKGQKGELREKMHPAIVLEIKDKFLQVKLKNPENKKERALWGTFQRIISNMVLGVSQGFEKKLELIGIGYRAEVLGNKLVLNVGFSHPVEFILPKNVEAKVEKNILTLFSIDKQLLGETAAQIRKIRKPEPYKGTGIRYFGELVRKKAGKKAVAAT